MPTPTNFEIFGADPAKPGGWSEILRLYASTDGITEAADMRQTIATGLVTYLESATDLDPDKLTSRLRELAKCGGQFPEQVGRIAINHLLKPDQREEDDILQGREALPPQSAVAVLVEALGGVTTKALHNRVGSTLLKNPEKYQLTVEQRIAINGVYKDSFARIDSAA